MADDLKNGSDFEKLQSIVAATKVQSDDLYAQWRNESRRIEEQPEEDVSGDNGNGLVSRRETLYLL